MRGSVLSRMRKSHQVGRGAGVLLAAEALGRRLDTGGDAREVGRACAGVRPGRRARQPRRRLPTAARRAPRRWRRRRRGGAAGRRRRATSSAELRTIGGDVPAFRPPLVQSRRGDGGPRRRRRAGRRCCGRRRRGRRGRPRSRRRRSWRRPRGRGAAVSGAMPPSTWSQIGRSPIIARSARSFGSIAGRKAWPPKPGLTVITRTRSHLSSTYSTAEGGVAGLSATPAFAPSSRMRARLRSRCGPASAWTVTMSAPAATKASRKGSAGAIIRWTSRAVRACGRSAATTSGPRVMLGTKWPSITSTCTQSAPAASTAATSSPSRAKSAERIEGTIAGAREKAGQAHRSRRIRLEVSQRPPPIACTSL